MEIEVEWEHAEFCSRRCGGGRATSSALEGQFEVCSLLDYCLVMS